MAPRLRSKPKPEPAPPPLAAVVEVLDTDVVEEDVTPEPETVDNDVTEEDDLLRAVRLELGVELNRAVLDMCLSVAEFVRHYSRQSTPAPIDDVEEAVEDLDDDLLDEDIEEDELADDDLDTL